MSKLKISQSLIKDWWDYRAGFECGAIFEFRHLKGKRTKPSEVMMLGSRFEYECTKALNLDGEEPPKVVTNRGYPVQKAMNLLEQVPVFKLALKYYKVTDMEINKTLSYDNDECIVEVHPDIICKMNGTPAIIDIKASGLLDSKFKNNDFSWDLEGLPFRHKLVVQPIHTKVVCQEAMYTENIPFYWWIFSYTGDSEARFIKAQVSINRIVAHLDTIEEVYNEITAEVPLGLTPRPSVGKCYGCDFKDICKHEMIIPEIQTVEII